MMVQLSLNPLVARASRLGPPVRMHRRALFVSVCRYGFAEALATPEKLVPEGFGLKVGGHGIQVRGNGSVESASDFPTVSGSRPQAFRITPRPLACGAAAIERAIEPRQHFGAPEDPIVVRHCHHQNAFGTRVSALG